jgi:hypothetical protein
MEMHILRYMLGTRKVKFSSNLRFDENENRIAYKWTENILTSSELHVHHPPAVHVRVNVISLQL